MTKAKVLCRLLAVTAPVLALGLSTSTAFAELYNLDVTCSDLQAETADSQSAGFRAAANLAMAQGRADGYYSVYAGHNCHLSTETNGADYDLMIMMKHNGIISRDFIPFSTVSVRAIFSGQQAALDGVTDGLTASGPSFRLENEQGTIAATVLTARVTATDDVRVLMRKISNAAEATKPAVGFSMGAACPQSVCE